MVSANFRDRVVVEQCLQGAESAGVRDDLTDQDLRLIQGPDRAGQTPRFVLGNRLHCRPPYRLSIEARIDRSVSTVS